MPLESLQQSQGTVTGILPCPEKTDVCCLEPQKDVHCPSAQKEKADIVNKNTDNSSTKGGLTEVTMDVSAQQNDELPVAVERKSSAAAEVTSCVTELPEEARNGQNSFQETSLKFVAVKSEHVPENVVKLEESTPNDSISDGCKVSQTEEESVVSICSGKEQESVTESHTVLAETKEEGELKSVGTTMINEGEVELKNDKYSPDTIINGEIPTSVINQTQTYDEQLSENKNIPVATVNAECSVLESAAVDQMPVKVAGAETKKARVSSNASCREQQ